MIAIEAHSDGCLLPVRAQPGARQTAIRGEQEGALKVSVTQVAEKGKANKAIIALLCKQLGLRRSQLTLVSGPAAQHKRFLIRDVSPREMNERIARLFPG
jgi:uncharacterized protein (TIGR00251 family)